MRSLKRSILLLLAAVTMAASFVFVACDTGKVGSINVPETLEAELGPYTSPDYDVVDKNGVVLYGYDVRLKSVKGPDGKALKIANESVTVSDAGVYTFVYTADSKKVRNAAVKIDFADRTAPKVNYDPSKLPSFYIKGNTYPMPDYTLSGDPDSDKCWAKVFHIAADDTETEVTVSGNRFKVDKEGRYAIRIHVEDAVGNANDYEYVRNVDGPEQTKENTVLYFGEAFGARQMKTREPSKYTGAFVSRAEAEAKNIPARQDANDTGYYAISFDGETETTHNEGYAIMDVPAVSDARVFSELSLWVYYDGDNAFPSYDADGEVASTVPQVVVGSTWWNDTAVKNKTWTKVTWSVNNWGYNVDKNEKQVSASDITGTQLRMVFDYSEKVKPNGTFYFTEMVGVPKVPVTLTAKDENVLIGGSKHYIGDSVELSAVAQDGKEVSHYTVDDVPLAGDTFVPTKEAHTVGVEYVNTALTSDNMTWGTWFDHTAGHAQWRKDNGLHISYAGAYDYWAIALDVTGGYNAAAEGNCKFNLSFAVGDRNSLEIYVGADFNGCKWYYKGDSTWGETLAEFNAEQIDLFKYASPEHPVKVLAVRRGQDVRVFVNGLLIGRTSLDGYSYTDDFGYGYRNDTLATGQGSELVRVANAKAVSGEKKTDLVLSEYVSTIAVLEDSVVLESNTVYFGDEVKLTPAEAPSGKIFAYYEVDGVRKQGSWHSFMATKPDHTVKAVFVDAVTLTAQDGAQVNGKSGEVKVPKGEAVTLTYLGAPAEGAFFDCFTVDGVKLHTDTFVPTADATVGAATATNVNGMTWGNDSDAHVENYSYTQSYTYSGTHAGAADYWVIDATVKYPTPLGDAWYIFDFAVGSNRFIQVRVHPTGIVEIKRMTWEENCFELTAEQKAKIVNACNTKDEVSVVCVRSGNDYTLLFEGEIVGKFTWDFGAADNKFGMGGCTISWNDKGNAWTQNADKGSFTYRYATGKGKVNAYLSAVRQIEVAQYEGKVVLGADGVYTLPDTVVKDGYGKTLDVKAEVLSVKDSAGNTYAVTDGKVTVTYLGAIGLEITYKAGDARAVVTVAVQRDSDLVLDANETGAKSIQTNDATVVYDSSKKHGDDNGSVKLTVNKSHGNQDYGYLNAFDWGEYDYLEFYVYTEATGVQVGAWWYGDTALTANAWTHVRLSKDNPATSEMQNYMSGRWIIRLMGSVEGVDFWFSSMRMGKHTGGLTSIEYAQVHENGSNATFEYVTDKKYQGADAQADDTGSLRVTGTQTAGAEISFKSTDNLARGINGYSSVYFYVYTDSDASILAGTYWCNDTALVKGQWTKVEIFRDASKNTNNGYDADGVSGKLFKENGLASNFIFRIQRLTPDTTVYISSLYGVK